MLGVLQGIIAANFFLEFHILFLIDKIAPNYFSSFKLHDVIN